MVVSVGTDTVADVQGLDPLQRRLQQEHREKQLKAQWEALQLQLVSVVVEEEVEPQVFTLAAATC